jgi:hypothetical protein
MHACVYAALNSRYCKRDVYVHILATATHRAPVESRGLALRGGLRLSVARIIKKHGNRHTHSHVGLRGGPERCIAFVVSVKGKTIFFPLSFCLNYIQ